MFKGHTSFPSVSSALKSTRDYTFRGNTFGQNGVFYAVGREEREIASNFDVAAEIRIVEEEMRTAGAL